MGLAHGFGCFKAMRFLMSINGAGGLVALFDVKILIFYLEQMV